MAVLGVITGTGLVAWVFFLVFEGGIVPALFGGVSDGACEVVTLRAAGATAVPVGLVDCFTVFEVGEDDP